MSRARVEPIFDQPVDDTISAAIAAFEEVDPPATLESLAFIEYEVRRFCTLPYIATCMVCNFDQSSASDGLWRYGQRVNIGARGMRGYAAVSHAEGSFAAGPQPGWFHSSGNGIVCVFAEKDGNPGVHSWPPVSQQTHIVDTGEDIDAGSATAQIQAFRLFGEDYAGAVVAGTLAPYIEGFATSSVVSVGGKYLPAFDLSALAGSFVTEAGDPLTAETGDRLTEEQ